jgi:hypothetical protein
MAMQPCVSVRVFTQSSTKAARWRQVQKEGPLTIVATSTSSASGASGGDPAPVAITPKSFDVSDRPELAEGCDMIVFALPAFLHGSYLSALEPFIEEGCVLVGLPGQNGFEFDVRAALGRRLGTCVVMNFESLPWICRIVEFGRSVRILGTKDRLAGAIQGSLVSARVQDPFALLQKVIGSRPRLAVSGHLLGITLGSLNAYSHPPIVYGRWRNWDGGSLDHLPLFYREVDPFTADLLSAISGEVVATSRRIMSEHPEVDLSQVIPMYDWDIACYGHQIRDKTNLMTALRTNSGYEGITHPMIRTPDGRYVPDFSHRFLSEDVPFGLAVIRGIAEIVRVPTPHLDSVLLWCQGKLGREYLAESGMRGRDLSGTRCPQRYGYTTIEALLGSEAAPAAARPRVSAPRAQ